MAIFNATPFEGFGLSAVTSGSTFGATHRLPQSSNPDIPAIVGQSSVGTVQEWQRAAWPQVVNNGVVTGEFRETLLGLAGLWKDQTPTAEEGQSGPILGSGSPAQDAAPPELQEDQGSSQVNKSVRESEEPEKPDAGTAG